DLRSATPEYFRTMGVALIRGRTFTAADRGEGAGDVVVINQSMAARYWGAEDPIGQRVTFDKGKQWLTIVGVVGDVKQYGWNGAAGKEMYLPWTVQPWRDLRVVIRAAGDPLALTAQLRAAVRDLDPAQPVTDVETLQALRDESLASPRLT